MKRWFKGLMLLPVAGILVLLALWAFDPILLRTILVVPVVLFLPGFALTLILFRIDRLGIPERLLLSVGLSVALTALIALVLNWTPWGIQPATVANALLIVFALEIAVIFLLYYRRWRTDVIGVPVDLNFTARQWIFMGLAALVAVTAIYVARIPARQQGFDGYTTLWIKPSDRPDTLRVGVNCEEFQTTKYQIRFELDGSIQEGPSLELEPGETWEGVLQLPNDEAAGTALTVLLYRLDYPNEVYRHAVWWLE